MVIGKPSVNLNRVVPLAFRCLAPLTRLLGVPLTAGAGPAAGGSATACATICARFFS